MSAGRRSSIDTAMEEGAIPGHIYAEKVGNLEVLYGVDQVVSATCLRHAGHRE